MIITMASRRCLQVISRQASAIFSTNPIIHSLKLTTSFPSRSFQSCAYVFPYVFNRIDPSLSTHLSHSRYLSSDSRDGDEEEEDEDEEEESEEDYDSEDDGVSVSSRSMKKEYSPEEKEAEAAAIGYRVIGRIQLDQPERIFKAYEPVFAVVQIGSHQFKVSNRDSIYTERLKFCEVNDRLILNKVLLLGSSSQTIVGRPTVPDAVVQAVVEEHALDAKVIIFKKKRRKNYRRTKGHRQELTKLRIISIQGINQPENTVEKPSKAANKKQEKVAVTA